MIALRNAGKITIENIKGNYTGKPVSKSEYIYIIRCEDSDYYKIGITNDLTQRIKSLQTGCPYELEYAFWIKYDENTNVIDIEYNTHIEMLNCQVRGEWYKLTDKDAYQLAGRLAHPIGLNNKSVECNWKAEGWTTAIHTDEGDIYELG